MKHRLKVKTSGSVCVFCGKVCFSSSVSFHWTSGVFKRLAKDCKLLVQGSLLTVFLQLAQHAGGTASKIVTDRGRCITRNIWEIKTRREQGNSMTKTNSSAIHLQALCTYSCTCRQTNKGRCIRQHAISNLQPLGKHHHQYSHFEQWNPQQHSTMAVCTSLSSLAFQEEEIKCTLIQGEEERFLVFSWVWISRNKDNRNYPPTVAECLTLICFILWFCCSTDQKEIAWDKAQKGTVLDRHTVCGRSQASPCLHVAGAGGTPPQVLFCPQLNKTSDATTMRKSCSDGAFWSKRTNRSTPLRRRRLFSSD